MVRTETLRKIILFLISLIFIGNVFFLFRWQIVHRDEFKTIAAGRFTTGPIASIRGEILARDGSTLAYSQPAWDVFVYLKDLENAEAQTESRQAIQSRAEFVSKVSTLLGKSEDELTIALNSGSQWIKIDSQIPFETKAKLEKIPSDKFGKKSYLIGLNFELNPRRIYPEGKTVSHITGFVGMDLSSHPIGRGGIEQKYNGVLEPQEGYVAKETDKFGNVIAISDSLYVRAKRGATIKTTIDMNLQEILAKKICEAVERYKAISAKGIIMDPKTGEILAIANCPTFDPNSYFTETNPESFSNRAIVIPYEIGSVAKVFTLSAAVDAIGMRPSDIILQGHTGCRVIVASNFNPDDTREICTYDKKPQGSLTVQHAFVLSDNLAFVQVAEKLGKEKFNEYLRRFGVGKQSGIDLTGESYGILPDLNDPKAWHPVDLAVFSYGHGYQINLLQAVKGIAAIANNGILTRPYVVGEIIEDNKDPKIFSPIAERRVVSELTAQTVKTMMIEIFRSNSEGGFKNLHNYQIAVKSGTALIPNRYSTGYSNEVNATYVGFDATDNAKFIMAIAIEAPQTVEKLSYYSARVVWMEIFEQIKDHLGLKPV